MDLVKVHVLPTVVRAFLGFLLAAGVGFTLALLLESLLKRVRFVVVPVMRFLEKLNPIALFPVFMLFWGIGDVSKIMLIFQVVVWIIALHTMSAIETVDPVLIQSGRSMGAKGPLLFWKVILPAAAPEIFHGIRLGLSIAFVFIISVEILSSSRGLGWFLNNAKNQYNLPNLYSTVLLMALIALALNLLLSGIERRGFLWKQDGIRQ